MNIPNCRAIPDCCWDCKRLDELYSELSDTTYRFCLLNIAMPVKKRTCKKQLIKGG